MPPGLWRAGRYALHGHIRGNITFARGLPGVPLLTAEQTEALDAMDGLAAARLRRTAQGGDRFYRSTAADSIRGGFRGQLCDEAKRAFGCRQCTDPGMRFWG